MKYLPLLLLFFLLFPVAHFGQFQLDPDFGINGKLRLHLDAYQSAVDVMQHGSNHILILAECGNPSVFPGNMDIALVKMDFQGQLEPVFGNGGVVRFDFTGMDISAPKEMRILNDGRILVLGKCHNVANQDSQLAALQMLLPNGNVDTTFGQSGTVFVSFLGKKEFPETLELTDELYIQVGGASLERAHQDIMLPAIARLDLEGVLDTTFGGTGVIGILADGTTYALKTSVHVAGGHIFEQLMLPDGKILAAGTYTGDAGANKGFICRLLNNGDLDTTFANSGTLYISMIAGGMPQRVTELKLLPNGEIFFGLIAQLNLGMDYMVGIISPDGNSVSTDFIDMGGNDEIKDVVCYNDGMILCGLGDQKFGFSWLADATQTSDHVDFQVDFDSSFPSEAQSAILVDTNLVVAAGIVQTADSGVIDLAIVGLRHVTETATDPSILLSEPTVVIYPNPAEHQIFVRCSDKNTLSVKIRIIAPSGIIVSESEFSPSEEMVVPIENLASGVYQLSYERSGFQPNVHSFLVR